MKLLFFTSTKAVHAHKWLKSLASEFDVHVAAFTVAREERIPGITYHEIRPSNTQHTQRSVSLQAGAANEMTRSIKQEAWLTFKNGIKFGRAFGRIICDVQPDLIHAHQSVPFGWYALMARIFATRRVPLIVSVWGTDVETYPKSHWLFAWMNRLILMWSTAVTATSMHLAASGRRWSKRNDWLIIPFGVDQKLFVPKGKPTSRAITFGMAKRLRFVGGVDVYGFDLALEAFARARKQNPQLRLEIAGSGPKESYLRQRVRELGQTNHVVFLGAVPQHQLSAHMAKWDALLLPSCSESFGVAAIEALSVGIPVVGSRIGGIPEIVTDGETGMLLEHPTPETLAQALLSVDSTLLNHAHTYGPEVVRTKYSWQNSLTKMKALYYALA